MIRETIFSIFYSLTPLRQVLFTDDVGAMEFNIQLEGENWPGVMHFGLSIPFGLPAK